MQKKVTLKFFIYSCLLLLFTAIAHANIDQTEKLKVLNQKIQRIKQHLQQDKNQKLNLSKNVENNSQAIKEISQRLIEIDQQIAAENMQLFLLKKKQLQFQTKLESQQNALAKQLQLTYFIIRSPYIKILLSQQNIHHINHHLHYYDNVNRVRINFIADINQTLQFIQTNQEQIQTQTNKLQQLKQQRQLEYLQLKETNNHHQHTLSLLTNAIAQSDQQLQTLMTNKQALEQVVSNIKENTFLAPKENNSFASLKGKLVWPILGSIIKHYGANIKQSGLHNNGVLIAAQPGEKVHAIAPGRVVFANKLSGFELLLIIDHGNGFMSLYGQNNGLYKSVGSTVNANEVIAEVGRASRMQQSGLYFEIRQYGHPINPEMWCNVNGQQKNKLLA